MARKRKSNPKSEQKTGASLLSCLNLNAAGVDIGATEIYIAVPGDRALQPVRCFSTFTEDLQAAAAWLKACHIETIAMESTGVYWIPLFQILEARGYKVPPNADTAAIGNPRHRTCVPEHSLRDGR